MPGGPSPPYNYRGTPSSDFRTINPSEHQALARAGSNNAMNKMSDYRIGGYSDFRAPGQSTFAANSPPHHSSSGRIRNSPNEKDVQLNSLTSYKNRPPLRSSLDSEPLSSSRSILGEKQSTPPNGGSLYKASPMQLSSTAARDLDREKQRDSSYQKDRENHQRTSTYRGDHLRDSSREMIRSDSSLNKGGGGSSGGRGLSRDKQLLDDEEEEEIRRQKLAQSSGSKVGAKKKKRKNPITANLSGTRYEVVRQVCDHLSYTIGKDEDPYCYMIWNDSFVSTDRITELKPYQRINHFPGMGEICRKDALARNMAKMAKNFPDEFNFVPKTWIFPSEYSVFQNYARELKKRKKNKTFIVKPSNGAMGNGIQVFRNAEKIPQNDHTIVQEYIDKPFTIDGYKCDMRIYVLVTSCDPLRIFLYNDGLLRISTEKYVHPSDNNVDHLYMHLTNYSVNKHNEEYVKSGNTETGSKRSLKYFNDYLRKHDYDVGHLWRNITEMLVKTIIVAHPHVLHGYRMCRPGAPPGADSVCFEVLGFDVMLDRKMRPWLLEVNRSPSFGTDEKLDFDIKFGVISDALRLLNIKASDKRKNIAAQKLQTQKRLMRPTKRIEGEQSELEKKRQINERRKEELKDMLARLRRDANREDYENRNCGRYKRIFPPEDKFRREKYAELLAEACGTLNGTSGTPTSLQKEIERMYKNKYREEELLDQLAQCEADEAGKPLVSNRPPKGPKPLCSMPTLSRDERTRNAHKSPRDPDDEDDDDDDTEGDSGEMERGWGGGGRSRPTSRLLGSRPGSRVRPASGAFDDASLVSTAKEREEELVKRTLQSLNEMRIKFPGKTDEEAEYILDKLHENWKFHKPRIASYWLVKLDSIKRRKVIDIVRSNVRAVLQRTWKCPDIDNLRLYRIFSRVFNRLLWSHGQGLWNCFQTSGSSWETIFSKSSETISPTEMACCRRIVQLCRDCLLIVYQFAAEAKSSQHGNNDADTVQYKRSHPSQPAGSTSSVLDKPSWTTPQTMSQRMSRLYSGRSNPGSGGAGSLASLNTGS